jgi:hypothetical protein
MNGALLCGTSNSLPNQSTLMKLEQQSLKLYNSFWFVIFIFMYGLEYQTTVMLPVADSPGLDFVLLQPVSMT